MADEIFGISVYRLILAYPVMLFAVRFGLALVLPEELAKSAFHGMLFFILLIVLVSVVAVVLFS